MTLGQRLAEIGALRLLVAGYVAALGAVFTVGVLRVAAVPGMLPTTAYGLARWYVALVTGAGLWLYPWAVLRARPLPGGSAVGTLYLVLGLGNLVLTLAAPAVRPGAGVTLVLTASVVALLVGLNQFWPVPLVRSRAA